MKKNEKEPTCTEPGGYDEAVYCTVCGLELSRKTIVLDALGHVPGEPVTENVVPATETTEGGYDLAVYCQRCGVELSRVHVVIPVIQPANPDEPDTPDTPALPTRGLRGIVSLVIEPAAHLHPGAQAEAFKGTMNWIKSHKSSLHIFDLVSLGAPVDDMMDEEEWELFKEDLRILDEAGIDYLSVASKEDVTDPEGHVSYASYAAYLEHENALEDLKAEEEFDDGRIWFHVDPTHRLLLVGIGYEEAASTEDEKAYQEKRIGYVNQILAAYPSYTAVLMACDFVDENGALTDFGAIIDEKILAVNDNVEAVICTAESDAPVTWNKTYGSRKVNAVVCHYSFDEEKCEESFQVVTFNGYDRTITVSTYHLHFDHEEYDHDDAHESYVIRM